MNLITGFPDQVRFWLMKFEASFVELVIIEMDQACAYRSHINSQIGTIQLAWDSG